MPRVGGTNRAVTSEEAFSYEGCWVVLRRDAVWNPDTYHSDPEPGGPVYVESVEHGGSRSPMAASSVTARAGAKGDSVCRWVELSR